MQKVKTLITLSVFIGIFIFFFSSSLFSKYSSKGLPEFKDVKKETETFIRYYYTLKLSPSEQKVLENALSELKAPCCSDFSALTC